MKVDGPGDIVLEASEKTYYVEKLDKVIVTCFAKMEAIEKEVSVLKSNMSLIKYYLDDVRSLTK